MRPRPTGRKPTALQKRIDAAAAANPDWSFRQVARHLECDEGTVRRRLGGRQSKRKPRPAPALSGGTPAAAPAAAGSGKVGGWAAKPVPSAQVAKMLAGTPYPMREMRIRRTPSGTTYTAEGQGGASTYLLRIADRSAAARGPTSEAVVDVDSFIAAATAAGAAVGTAFDKYGNPRIGGAHIAPSKITGEARVAAGSAADGPCWDSTPTTERWAGLPPDFDAWKQMADSLACAADDPERRHLSLARIPAGGEPLASSVVGTDGYRIGAFGLPAEMDVPADGITLDAVAVRRFTAAAARAGCASTGRRAALTVSLAQTEGGDGTRTTTMACGPVSMQVRPAAPHVFPDIAAVVPDAGDMAPAAVFADPDAAVKWLRKAARGRRPGGTVIAVVSFDGENEPVLTAVRTGGKDGTAQTIGAYPGLALPPGGGPARQVAFNASHLADAIASAGQSPVLSVKARGRKKRIAPMVISDAGRDFADAGNRTLLVSVAPPAPR